MFKRHFENGYNYIYFTVWFDITALVWVTSVLFCRDKNVIFEIRLVFGVCKALLQEEFRQVDSNIAEIHFFKNNSSNRCKWQSVTPEILIPWGYCLGYTMSLTALLISLETQSDYRLWNYQKTNDKERNRLYKLAIEALLEADSRTSYLEELLFIVYELKSESPQIKLFFEI